MTRWPKQTHKACTLERARYVLMVLVLILICLDLNYFWTHGVPNRPDVGCRNLEETAESFRELIWPAINNAVLYILPLVVVSVCVIITVVTLVRRTSIQEEEMRDYMHKYFLELPALLDFRSVMLTLSLLFMVLVIIQTTHTFIMYLFMRGFFDYGDCNESQEIMVTMLLTRTIEYTLQYMFCSTKIYIYVGLSPAFRARLVLGFQTAWKRLLRMIHLCGCSCVNGRPRWTLVPRCDEAVNKTGHKKKPGQQQQVDTRVLEDEQFGIEGQTSTENENVSSGASQGINVNYGNHSDRNEVRARHSMGAGPSQYACDPREGNSSEDGRNGEVVRSRNSPGIFKPQGYNPNRSLLGQNRKREHTMIAVDFNNSNMIDFSKENSRPVSFGDHFV